MTDAHIPLRQLKRTVLPLIAITALAGALIGCDANDLASPLSTATKSATNETPKPTTDSDTDEPAKTDTDEADADEAEADDAEEEAPEPEVNVYDEHFGTFKTIKKSGRGDTVVKLPKDVSSAIVTADHNGSSNFVIEALDSDNEMTELLVNEIGSYSGTVATGIIGEDSTRLKVTADGKWTLKIKPISAAPRAKAELSGKSDAVFRYEGDATIATFTHKGGGNFVVMQSDGTWPDLLINEIGTYNGTVPLSSGPSLLLITADGKWTMTEE